MLIKYKGILETPALTGKDGVIGKDVDIVTKVDKDGFPYFSGSQIKGILKEKVEMYGEALGIKFPTENIFGKEGNVESGIRCSALTLDKENKCNEYKEYLLDSRSGIRINRESRTTSEGSLFSYEFIRQGMDFQGEIEIFEELKVEEEKILKAALERIDFIGGLKSRGLGKIKIHSVEIEKNSSNKKELKNNEFKTYKYEIELEENVVLKNNEIGNEVTTNDYIHGGTLRGALITYLDKNFKVDADNLVKNMKVSQGLPVGHYIVPASIVESKYPVGDNKKKRNLLLSDKDSKKAEAIKYERLNSPMVDSKFEKFKINKENEINIAIDSESRTAKDGQIFNKEVLVATGIKYEGYIEITDEIAKELSNKYIYIGKYKSKGLGKAKIVFKNENRVKNNITKEELEKFSSEIKSEDKNKKYFTIDFCSDMIIPFSDTKDIGKQITKKIFLTDDIKWEEDKSFVNIISIGGYNQLNQIRKATEFAIGKGGVLTFSVDEFSQELVELLNKVQKNGIGSRKAEGFGDVEISSKKHMEVKND